MSRRDFLPRADDKLLSFADNFAHTAAIDPAAVLLTQSEVDVYIEATRTFAQTLRSATQPETRGLMTVFLKNEARQTLVRLTRAYARQINAQMSVSDDQRLALGLNIRQRARDVAVPTESPVVRVERTDGRRVSVSLGREILGSRARPIGVAGATIFTRYGASAADNESPWHYVCNTTKTTVDLTMRPSDVGDVVWIIAQWRNAKDEPGPMSRPMCVNLPAGGERPGNVGLKSAA